MPNSWSVSSKSCSTLQVCFSFLKFSEHYSSFEETPYKKRKKPKVEPLDFDDTVDCFILRTMRKCFSYYLETAKVPDEIVVPETIIKFTFKRLDNTQYTPAVNRQAALLLGSFSTIYFEEILKLFLEQFNAIKKEADVKNFVHLQSSMVKLSLSFNFS
jgi:hypothetical protein